MYNDQSDFRGVTHFTKRLSSLESLRRRWGWFLALGLALIFLGIIAISGANFVTELYVRFLGILLAIGGVLQIAYASWSYKWSGFFLSLLAGILYTVVGILFIVHPTASAVTLTLILAVLFLAEGVFHAVSAFLLKFEQWGWAFFSGLVKFALGLLILIGWPGTGLWVLGLFIGIDLITYGWFWVLVSLALRNFRIG